MKLDQIYYPEQLDRADYVMIGLHGRNANKYAFFPFVRQMGFLHTRWVLPSGTYVSAQSPDTHWWFDNTSKNADEIAVSRELISALIDEHIGTGIPPENIFLAGFSQGAVMAIDTALRFPKRLGGVVALSGYVVHPDALEREAHRSNRNLPLFVAHGERDTILAIDVGRENNRVLTALGYNVEYREYDTAHRVSSSETKDIRAFLHRHMYGMFMDDPRRTDDHVVVF